MSNKETPQVIAAILLSCAGVFMVFGMPFFVGGLISELGFSQAQANLISSAEIAGMALSSLLGAAWIGRFNWRHIAMFGLLAVLGGNLVSCYVDNFQALVATRFITGLLGHGTAFALGIAAIGSTSQPDRNFGFTIASQVVMGALTALIVPKTIATYGIAGMCVPAAILAVVAMVFMPKLATSGHAQNADPVQSKKTGILLLPLLGLFIMIIWQMGVGPFYGTRLLKKGPTPICQIIMMKSPRRGSINIPVFLLWTGSVLWAWPEVANLGMNTIATTARIVAGTHIPAMP